MAKARRRTQNTRLMRSIPSCAQCYATKEIPGRRDLSRSTEMNVLLACMQLNSSISVRHEATFKQRTSASPAHVRALGYAVQPALSVPDSAQLRAQPLLEQQLSGSADSDMSAIQLQ